jgi:NAD(P)-dependent dehydrogenase (short-subunit alcohol dehydrogenase family)
MNYLFAGASSAIAQSCAEKLQQSGNTITALSTRQPAYRYSAYHLVESYEAEHLPALEGSLDGLVYFPGTINLKPFQRLSRADFIRDFEINVLGGVTVLQKYLPLLRKSPAASVVFISSVAATTGMPFHASISIAKAGIEGLTKSLAAELAPQIRVNCVAPSLVNTPLAERLVNTPEKQEAMSKRNPLHRIGKTEDIAAMICFLLSPDSTWISGQVLAVDGGMNHLKI